MDKSYIDFIEEENALYEMEDRAWEIKRETLELWNDKDPTFMHGYATYMRGDKLDQKLLDREDIYGYDYELGYLYACERSHA